MAISRFTPPSARYSAETPAPAPAARVPGLIRVRRQRGEIARGSSGMPRLSSSFAEAAGIAGCARMAIWRTTSAVTYSTVPCRAGSVFASAHGASPAK